MFALNFGIHLNCVSVHNFFFVEGGVFGKHFPTNFWNLTPTFVFTLFEKKKFTDFLFASMVI